jgi:hypothetical protein
MTAELERCTESNIFDTIREEAKLMRTMSLGVALVVSSSLMMISRNVPIFEGGLDAIFPSVFIMLAMAWVGYYQVRIKYKKICDLLSVSEAEINSTHNNQINQGQG